MATRPGEPAFLTDDLELQFVDAEHFEREVETNLKNGRASVRSRQKLGMYQVYQVQIAAPGTSERMTMAARVVFSQDDLHGLELTDLDAHRMEDLRKLLEAAKNPSPSPAEPVLPDGPAEDSADLDDASTDGGATVVQPSPVRSARTRSDTVVSPLPSFGRMESSPSESRSVDPGAGNPEADPSLATEAPTREHGVAQRPEGSAAASPNPGEGAGSAAPRGPSVLPTSGASLGPGDVLHVPEPALLLSAYLSWLKTERFVVEGTSRRTPGETFQLQVQLSTECRQVEAAVVRTSGAFTVLSIPDPTPLADMLAEQRDALLPLLEGTGLGVGTEDSDSEAVGRPSDEARRKTEDLTPPQAPTLKGNTVDFRSLKDLQHELQQNVKNGGLFVESGPLPMRERRPLTISVGGRTVIEGLTADVVFADGGRVGFSFANPDDAVQQLTQALLRLDSSDLPEDPAGTVDLRTTAAPVPNEGRISAVLSDSKLLAFEKQRIRDPSQLVETSLLQLFEYLVNHKVSGVLRIEDGERFRKVYIHQGDVVFIEAKPFEEHTSLGRILVAQKKLTASGLRDALERSRGSSRLVGRMLVLLGVIKRSDLVMGLREQTRAKMDSAFGWSSGRYVWEPWSDPPGDSELVATKGISVMARHLRSRFGALSQAQLEELFSGGWSHVFVHHRLEQRASGLGLQPRELRFLELSLDGTKNLQEAVMGSALGRLASLRLLAVCLAFGAIRPREGEAPLRLRSGGSAAANRDTTRDELQGMLDLMAKQNHFEVLGVHWSSHHRTLRGAWEQMRARYDAKRPPLNRASKEARAVAAQITKRIDEAYDMLKEHGKRVNYRKELFTRTERQYAADMLVKKGEVSLMRGDRVDALTALETAAELDPSERNRALLAAARDSR